ncbi:MAG: toxin-antitoxin system YwqK family antitoxin [Helicobacteraceae bacterium]|nr:toxin-antitoxin system YwqK family antitoxin [Helicobacteraceae bacterium]
MKRVLIAILLATMCQNASEDYSGKYEVYVLNKTARVDGNKCVDMEGNLLPGKAKMVSLKDGSTITNVFYMTYETLCVDGELLNGVIREYDDKTGRLRYEIPYKNGKIEGVWKGFYKNGELWLEAQYKNNVREGIQKEYSLSTGELEFETSFKDDEMDGISKDYWSGGALQYIRTYKNGKQEGIEKFFSTSGELGSETPYKNGLKNGIEKSYYYESGKLERETAWKNGAKEGETKVFRENGEIWGVFTYKKGKAISGVCHKTNGEKAPLAESELRYSDSDYTFKTACD